MVKNSLKYRTDKKISKKNEQISVQLDDLNFEVRFKHMFSIQEGDLSIRILKRNQFNKVFV